MENVYNYLKNYDRLFNINTTTYDIIDDVVNFPDEYLSLYRVIEKQEKYPIFIYNNYLIIGMRSLINKYQYRQKKETIDTSKMSKDEYIKYLETKTAYLEELHKKVCGYYP